MSHDPSHWDLLAFKSHLNELSRLIQHKCLICGDYNCHAVEKCKQTTCPAHTYRLGVSPAQAKALINDWTEKYRAREEAREREAWEYAAKHPEEALEDDAGLSSMFTI